MLKAFESGMIMVPPTASQFVLASQLDLDAMQPIWEVALSNVSEDVSIPQFAQLAVEAWTSWRASRRPLSQTTLT